MISGFDFNTRELLVYAIIYGFSQDSESVFSGSLSYLARWLNISRRDNVLRYLNSLVEKGVIVKEKKSTSSSNWCEYKAAEVKGEIKSCDYIFISPFMIEDLGLKDKELILYALIYGFSRKGSDSYFTGNNAYMAKWLKINKANVNRYTSSLIEKGLLERIEDGRTIKYRAIVPENTPNHFEYTPINTEGVGDNQNEYTPNQNEYRGNQFEEDTLINLSTNNLTNNLNNNLVINNDIDTEDSGTKPLSLKEVEKNIRAFNSSYDISKDKELVDLLWEFPDLLRYIADFDAKCRTADNCIYRNSYLINDFLKYAEANRSSSLAFEAKDLMDKVLHSFTKQNERKKIIIWLNEKKNAEYLYGEAFKIFSEDGNEKIYNKEAYLAQIIRARISSQN